MPNFRDIDKIAFAHYNATVNWDYLQQYLKEKESKEPKALYVFEMVPDFQRGHVWTTNQQTKYVEFILRGGFSGKDIYWNCPGWMRSFKGPLQLVDGLQRITAVLAFLENKIPAFGHNFSQWEGHLPTHCFFNMHINNLNTRTEVLKWYLDLNEGGIIHTYEEITRVKNLLEKEKKN